MFRKHILSLALPVLLFSGISRAQSLPLKPDFGVKLGANFEQLNGNTWVQSYKPGIVGGVFLGVHKKKMGVQIEALINTSHYTASGLFDSVKDGDFRATYIDIPLLFEYKLFGKALLPKLWLVAGPQFSSLVSVKDLNSASNDVKSSFKSGNFSGVIGAELRLLKLTVGARYLLGLTNINNVSSAVSSNIGGEAWKTRTVQVYLGFRFI